MPQTPFKWKAELGSAFNTAYSAQLGNVTYYVTSRDYGHPAYLEVRDPRGGLKRLDLGAQTPPTATEAFNLRIRCKQMADQKSNDLAAVNALLKWEVVQSSSSSRYDATNNRCYILTYHHIRKPGYEKVVRQLFDAQVDDLLADASISDGKKSGSIWDESYKGQRFFKDGDAAWEGAVTYMNELMADPRKQ